MEADAWTLLRELRSRLLLGVVPNAITADDLRARLRRERDELIDRIEYIEDSLAALDVREDPGLTEAWAHVR